LVSDVEDEHGLRVSENWVLRKVRGSKGDELTSESRRLRKEELYELYSSPNTKARRMRWAGYEARMGGRGGAYRIFCGETGGEGTTWKT
jgi:hypothetical protein